MTNILVREATLDDITEIAAMAMTDLFWEQVNSYSMHIVNVSKATENLTGAVVNDNGILLVSTIKNRIVGFVLGEVVSSWWCDEVYSTDYALYVHSKYRHLGIGYKLLKSFNEISKAKGASKFVTGLSDVNFNVKSMEKLLHRQGFVKVATFYEKEF
jgi:ribosomal protein S18 acetylase RimI-like enzyme